MIKINKIIGAISVLHLKEASTPIVTTRQMQLIEVHTKVISVIIFRCRPSASDLLSNVCKL